MPHLKVDCHGVCGGDAEVDKCGVCGGDSTSCDFGKLEKTMQEAARRDEQAKAERRKAANAQREQVRALACIGPCLLQCNCKASSAVSHS